jgi:hypothetical protein
LFDVLMATRLISAARRATAADRLASLPRLERASATLAAAARAALRAAAETGDGEVDVAAVWAAVERVASREQLHAAAAVVEELVPDAASGERRVDPAEDALRQALTGKYAVVRPFLALLAGAPPLAAVPAAQPLLAEVRRLPELARRRVAARPLTPEEMNHALVPAAWRRAVFPGTAVDRDAYVVCVLEQLRTALRRRDVYATPSLRWADPRAQLLGGEAWDAVRGEVLTGLGLSRDVEGHLGDLTGALDVAWRQLGDRLTDAGPDATVRLVSTGSPDEGRIRLALDRLEAVGDPASLTELRATVAAMLPRVDLPEVLLEVHS